MQKTRTTMGPVCRRLSRLMRDAGVRLGFGVPLLALVLALQPLPSLAIYGDVPKPGAAVEGSTSLLPTVTWARDLDAALRAGLADYKPVLALFSLPDCGWCYRLKAELASPSLRAVLDSYILVEVDGSSLEVAQRYGIRSAPTVLVFSGDGRTRGGFTGYQSARDLERTLSQYVNISGDVESDLSASQRFARLTAGTLEADDWPALMYQLGDPTQREKLRQAILGLDPYPATNLVAMLASIDLAVRIGAIELLEEHTGEDFAFDPWVSPFDARAQALRQPWQSWAAAGTNHTGRAESIFASLTDARIARYIGDILGDDRFRTTRAMQMLEAGGHHAARQLAVFVQDHPDLASGLSQRLREVQYAILLHGTPGHDASATAHQIVFGNLDTRIRTVLSLPKTGAGIRAIPILRDLFADENPLLREAACEATIAIAGGVGTVIIVPFLATEADVNVLFSALRALGDTKSPRAVMALLPYLEHPNEDLVIVALEGLAKLKYTKISEQLGARLADPRWRVRVAALETITKLKIDSLREQVSAVIQDEDAFVRHAAISALAATSTPEEFEKSAATLFRDLPDQRALVIKAMAEHDLAIPEGFVDAIASDDSPDRIVACLAAASDLGKQSLGLAGRMVSHSNPDVSAAALAIIMRHGVSSGLNRRHIIDAFNTRTGAALASLVEDLHIDSAAFQPFALQFRHWLAPGGSAAATTSSGAQLADPLQAIIGAFENPGAATPSATPPKRRQSFANLLAAFDDVAEPRSATPGAARMRPVSFPQLINAIERLTTNAHPRVVFLAAAKLVSLGHAGLVPTLMEGLDERTSRERSSIADVLNSVKTPAAMDACVVLLADKDERVRAGAAETLMANWKSEGLVAVIDELLREGSPLLASEASFGYRLDGIPSSRVRQQGQRLLASDRPQHNVLGIILTATGWQPSDYDLIAPYVESENPYVRSAAVRVLGTRAPAQSVKHLTAAVLDTSPVVRAAIPRIYFKASGSEVISLSKDEAIRNIRLNSDPFRRAAVAPLGDFARETLHSLADDSHPPVRFQALLALLTRAEPVDVSRLAAALDALDDAPRAAQEVMQALTTYDDKVRPELHALGASLRKHLADSYWQARVDRVFGPSMTEHDLLAVNVLTRFDTTNTPALVTLDMPVAPANATNPPPALVFFYQPGCNDCREVRRLLADMPNYFSGLKIHTYNVRQRDAALLNEALCDHFDVPANVHLVAPALFAADGALVGEAINFDSLTELLARSTSLEDGQWYKPRQAALAQAETSIQARYSETIKTSVIALIALTDGINPCAFATIIFLLSYLHIARRNTRQVLQVGAAFIVGVFVAYFAMGVGLVSLLDRITFLSGLSRIVNYGMAAFVLLIALLSIRDGILCLRGRMGDMTLQLPGPLKQQIHTVIRHGARHRRYVMAAFGIGVVISIIELPCTGQAYLPTIAYMVRDTQLRAHALLHLLLYNILFIVPLIIIFILAAFGMTHDRLTAVLRKHAAMVKFATAALFLLLFAIFLMTH